jgi:hypothetical protein
MDCVESVRVEQSKVGHWFRVVRTLSAHTVAELNLKTQPSKRGLSPECAGPLLRKQSDAIDA